MTMLPVQDFSAAPELGYEEWRAVLRSIVGRYNPEGIEPNTFEGRVSIRNLFGFSADLGITMLTVSIGPDEMCASMM